MIKTYNIIGKNNDMVITVSGEDKDEVIETVKGCINSNGFYVNEVEE